MLAQWLARWASPRWWPLACPCRPSPTARTRESHHGRHPSRPPALTVLYLAVLLPIAAVTGGCPGTAGPIYTGGPDDPEISDFQIQALTPERSGQTIRWRITARIADRNDDVVGGEGEAAIHEVNGVRSAPTTGLPTMRLTIIGSDLSPDGVFTAILFIDNAPAGEIEMTFAVSDAAGHLSIRTLKGFTLRVSGTSAPGAATRPEEIRGGLTHA